MSEAASPPIESLSGVGAARAVALQQLGIHTARDLIEYFPRRYELHLAERPIAELIEGPIQTARGEVVAVDYMAFPRKRFEATIADETGSLGAVWFNGAYLRTRLHPGQHVQLTAKVKFFRGLPQMANPKWEPIKDTTRTVERATFKPIYPASSKLSSDVIAGVVGANLDGLLGLVDEWFEESWLRSRGLMPRREAYRLIHQPGAAREAGAARRRLVYDELMLMQIGLGISRRLRDGRVSAPRLRLDKTLDERIRARFGFELTEPQLRAAYEIARDLNSGRPMNRLLQGDVGSGKTVVALHAMLTAVANKMQAALLAPTEVLAEQHFLTLSTMLAGSTVRIERFTGRSKRAGKAALLKSLATGQTHIAVGTQALLQPDVEFANLGLVVIDEQHKLGVEQRQHLRQKSHSVHSLVMTATPIPRTLALSYFADVDVSTIDTLPPGRQPIQTRWVRSNLAADAYTFVRKQIATGRQAYVVVPQVEDNETEDVASVKKKFEQLQQGGLAGLRLAMLHGKMPADDRDTAMRQFRAGEIDVVIATTVIEVGIDVPNATVVVIESAERFGLSQLHQLRGRVGRGEHASHCLLISDATTDDAVARLTAMTETTDGFAIAELDLSLRGPGQFFGTGQHGLPELKLTPDLSKEMEMLTVARDDAAKLLADDPNLARSAHRALRLALVAKFGDSIELAQVG